MNDYSVFLMNNLWNYGWKIIGLLDKNKAVYSSSGLNIN